jgi:hypothetical protein
LQTITHPNFRSIPEERRPTLPEVEKEQIFLGPDFLPGLGNMSELPAGNL